MTRPAAMPLLLAALALPSGCSKGGREAASLVAAVDRFRQADTSAMPGALDAMERAPCAGAEQCAARSACLDSARATARGITLKREVEASLSALERGTLSKDDARAQSLPGKLDEASRLLTLGHEQMGLCDQQITKIRLKYAL